jgi:hypothetical protein
MMMVDLLSGQIATIKELDEIYITGESGKLVWNDRKEGMADLWQEGTMQKQIGRLKRHNTGFRNGKRMYSRFPRVRRLSHDFCILSIASPSLGDRLMIGDLPIYSYKHIYMYFTLQATILHLCTAYSTPPTFASSYSLHLDTCAQHSISASYTRSLSVCRSNSFPA